MMLTVVNRAFASNLQKVSASPSEQAVLESQGIQNPTLQAYLAWRRSLMLFIIMATILSAGLSTYREVFEEDRPSVIETIGSRLAKNPKLAVPLAVAAGTIKANTDGDENSVTQQLLNAATAIAKPDEDDAEPAKTGSTKSSEEDDDEDPPKTWLTKLDDLISLISLYGLPLAALAITFWWTNFRLTFRILVSTFAFSFLIPILLLFCPWSWWDGETIPSAGSVPTVADSRRIAEGLLIGLNYLVTLLPTVLSLLPGVQKACIKVKTLLPQSVLPGWFLVAASPFYALFLLVICVTINQVFDSPFVIVGMLLVMGSSLVYGIRMQVFTRPLVTDGDFRQMQSVQRMASMMTMVAGVSLLIYITTQKLLGMHLLGLDPKTSLVLPIDVVEFVLETIGRGMFMTVLGADVFVRMSLAAWQNARDFQSTEAAKDYDDTMSALERAV